MSHLFLYKECGSLLILSFTSSIGKCNTALVILAIALFSRSWFPLFRILPQTASWYESLFVFTSQRAAWLRQQGCPDHLSARGMEHLWIQFKRQGTYEEWKLIADISFHDLRHDFAHRARQSGWLLEEIAVYAGHQTKDGTPAIATTVRYTLPSRTQLKERIQLLQG